MFILSLLSLICGAHVIHCSFGESFHELYSAPTSSVFSHTLNATHAIPSDVIQQETKQGDSRQITSLGTNIFLARRRFNTSAGFYVPAFSFIVPDQAPLGSSLSLANQAIYGLFSALTVAGMFAEPMLVTRVRPAVTSRDASSELTWESSLKRIMSSRKLNSFMNHDTRNQIGLDGEMCLQKTICHVFRDPDRYGKYSWPFTTFISPPRTQVPSATWYEEAAGVGKYSDDDCGHRYKCFFDVLDLLLYYIDWFTAKLQSSIQTPDGATNLGGDLSTNLGEMRLTNAFEEPFYKAKVFNQTFRLCVPIAGFSWPFRGLLDSTTELTNQVLYFMFILLVTVMIFAVPILFTGTRPFGAQPEDSLGNLKRGFDHKSNHVMHILGLDIQNHIGINSAKCLQRTICEAHRNPEEYGLITLPFRMFFPPATNGTDSSKITWYQEAAFVGKYSNKNCGKSYYCIADFLDLFNYLTDWWIHSRDPIDSNSL